MSSFDQQLVSWQPFFITMAGVCATFSGLLFLALSLHVHQLGETAKVNLKRLAQHTFADFLIILFVSVFCMVPKSDHKTLGLWLLVVATIGFFWLFKSFKEAMLDKSSVQHRGYFLKRMGFSLFAHVLLIVGAICMLENVDTKILDYWLLVFGGTIALLISATRNAWFLLIHELDQK
jgi:hypothetical protein